MPYVTSIERLARQEGKAEGKAEGKVEGKVEGRVEEKADSVLRLLRRLTTESLPEDLVSALRGTVDPARLDQWFEIAADAKSVKEFRTRAGI